MDVGTWCVARSYDRGYLFSMRWSSTSKVRLLSTRMTPLIRRVSSSSRCASMRFSSFPGQCDDTLADRHVDGLRLEKEQPPHDVLSISSSITSSGFVKR